MLTPSELKNLKGYFKTKKFKKDEIIFPQGQVADGAYIVLSGLIHLKKKHKTANIIEHIGEIGPGDTFGAWYILFESELRSVSAEAFKDSELVFIPNEILQKKLRSSDPFIIYCFRKWIDLIKQKKVPENKSIINEENRKNDPDFSTYVS